MIDKRLGKRIQECREKANISQEELAEWVDLSTTSISNIERGANYPTTENLIKILNAVGASSDDVFIDIVHASDKARSSQLSRMLERPSPENRQLILAVVETMIENLS